jgi:hypothetical protein
VHETIVVTGTYEPLPLDEIDRDVLVLPVRDLCGAGFPRAQALFTLACGT